MSKTFKAQLAKLPKAQRQLWPLLGPLKELGMVLHGGTAIALYLGHRESVDFDFFIEKSIDRKDLVKAFPSFATATILQDEPNSITGIVSASGAEIKVSFFGGIDFGRVGEPAVTGDGVARVASLDDLLAQKLKVVMQRVEAKDYQDIAALLHSGLPLARGVSGAMALFGEAFSPMDCAKALVYFKGGDLAKVTKQDRETLLAAVRSLGLKIKPATILSKSLS